MSQFDGVWNNHSLVTIINDLHGKEVLVELRDGNKYSGIFAACSNDLEIGLKYAFQKNAANEKNLLPKKSEVTEKMIFNYTDIVCISALISEEKKIKGFATDRDYHLKSNGKGDEEELEEWEGDDDVGEIETQMLDQRTRYQRNGWSVSDMFNANSKLGVQSSFEDDLRQYTTAEVEGTDEDRARAEQIAREIENSASSKYYSRLENDDEERDLDKITTEEELETSARRGGRGGAYSNVSRNSRGGNMNMNRRSDGMKGGSDRRSTGSGRYNSYGQQQRGQQHYIPGQNKRPTGQEVQEQFQEFKESASRKENTGKVFENSTFKGQPKVILENANRGNSDRSGNQGSMHWRKNVNIHSSKTDRKNDNDNANQGNSTNESESVPRAAAPTGNAWNKGPPMGLLNNQTAQLSNPSPASPGSAVPADPQPNPDGPAASTSMDVESRDASVEEPTISEDKENSVSSASAVASVEKKEGGEQKEEKEGTMPGTKKFAFNVNAPAFTPRMAPQNNPAAQVIPIQPQPMQPMPAIPMGAVSAGMPMQTAMQPPPGVFTPMPGRSVVVPYPQSGPQGFSSTQYPQYLVQPPVVGSMAIPQRGGGPPGQVAYAPAPQGNQRRSTGPNTGGAVMMPTGGQWQNQMIMQQVSYGYQYTLPGGATAPPTYVDGTQMIPQGQQQIPPQSYQQRYGPPPIGYVVPQQGMPQGQQRYASGQQIHEGSNPPHTPAISTTGPNSQPPTPGPQPSASPAQVSQANGGRGSPSAIASVPPPAQPQQQFVHVSGNQPPMVSHQQQLYSSGPNMVVYPQVPQVIMYSHTGSMPVGHMQPYGEHHHMEGGVMQPGASQQMVVHDQYGNFVPSGGGYYQAPPQHPNQQQPMSRQNSVPQAVYAPQSSPPGMQQPNAPSQGNPGSAHPPASQ